MVLFSLFSTSAISTPLPIREPSITIPPDGVTRLPVTAPTAPRGRDLSLDPPPQF
jgi:hypothetical protein